jgi:hypothetical protein
VHCDSSQCLSAFVDERQCLRTEKGWEHFLNFNSDKHWYFKGGHDTFDNVTGLEPLLVELEEGCDPMKEVMFSFNLHDWDDYLYSQDGSGWIFSNYAVQAMGRSVTMWPSPRS